MLLRCPGFGWVYFSMFASYNSMSGHGGDVLAVGLEYLEVFSILNDSMRGHGGEGWWLDFSNLITLLFLRFYEGEKKRRKTNGMTMWQLTCKPLLTQGLARGQCHTVENLNIINTTISDISQPQQQSVQSAVKQWKTQVMGKSKRFFHYHAVNDGNLMLWPCGCDHWFARALLDPTDTPKIGILVSIAGPDSQAIIKKKKKRLSKFPWHNIS